MPPTQDYPATNQWLMAEDEALKELLSGLKVPGSPKAVPVYFRFPEAERQIVYPFITIDLLGIEPAYDLWTSTFWMHENEVEFEDEYTGNFVSTGLYEPSVSPDVFNAGVTLDTTKPLWRMNYLTYRLFYQVTTWSKMFAHDRAMTAQLIRDILHPRPSWLVCGADSTWRRLEPLGWSPADIPVQEGNIKRIFRKAFTLSVQSEIPQDRLEDIEQRAEISRIALRGYYTSLPPEGTEADEAEHWTEDESHILPGDTDWEVLHERETP